MFVVVEVSANNCDLHRQDNEEDYEKDNVRKTL
jgi:hypothetical protein